MNLVWHIVKKDFTRMRLPLLLWTCLLLGQIILCERMFSGHSTQQDWFMQQGGIISVLVFLYTGIGYILMAMLVLEDTLVGSTMFWASRPISGGRLLAAKLLGGTLFFVVWPVLVGLPWWLWCGLGLDELVQATRMTALMHGMIIVPAFLIAALAGQSTRFLLWSLVMIVAVPAGTGIVAYNLPKDLPQELLPSRVMVAYAVGLLTAAVVVWLQFRSRRLVRSVVVTLAGAGVALLVGLFWPWDVLRFWPKDTTQLSGTEVVSVDFSQASVHKRDNKGWATLKFTLNGLPEDLMILNGMMDVEFRWPDGTTFRRRAGLWTSRHVFPVRPLLDLQPAQADPATEEKRQQMQEAYRERVLARQAAQAREPGPVNELTTVFQIPLELLTKFTATPPACTASLRLDGSRPALLMELPLQAGISRRAHGTRLSVIALEDSPVSSPTEHVTQRMATVVHSGTKDLIRVQFHLVDRAHGTETQLGFGGGNSLIPLPMLPLRVYRTPLPIKIPQVWRDEKWVGMPEWLEADTLAVVGLRKDGAFDRTLQTARLEFVAK